MAKQLVLSRKHKESLVAVAGGRAYDADEKAIADLVRAGYIILGGGVSASGKEKVAEIMAAMRGGKA